MYQYCGSMPIPFFQKPQRHYRALGNLDLQEDGDNYDKGNPS